MGLMDYLKGQFLEIIQWTDDSRDTLSWRFPDEDKEIKHGAQLIVRESQIAQFVYLGQFGDTFMPGKHDLVTDNIPILSTLKGWKYGFESPFKADVYYVTTRLFTGNKWGTSNPIMMRDQDFGIVRVRAFGTFDFRIIDPKIFLKEVAGSDHHFRLDEFARDRPADRRLMHADRLRHHAQRHRFQMRYAMTQEIALAPDNFGCDRQYRARPLVEAPHQPIRILQFLGKKGPFPGAGAAFGHLRQIIPVDQQPRQSGAVQLD